MIIQILEFPVNASGIPNLGAWLVTFGICNKIDLCAHMYTDTHTHTHAVVSSMVPPFSTVIWMATQPAQLQ